MAGELSVGAQPGDSRNPKNETELLEIAQKRYHRGLEVDGDNRDHALTCLKFRNLEQWDPEVKNFREKDPEGARPCLVADKTNQYLNQVINDYRQNRPAINVSPVGRIPVATRSRTPRVARRFFIRLLRMVGRTSGPIRIPGKLPTTVISFITRTRPMSSMTPAGKRTPRQRTAWISPWLTTWVNSLARRLPGT